MKHLTKSIKSRNLSYLLMLLFSLTIITSCKKQDDNDFTSTVTANVRLVNASTDAGPAKLYLSDALRTSTAVSFGGSSNYSLTYTGQVDVAVQSASSTVLATTNTGVDASGNYTFFLTGTAGNYALITLNDNTTAAASGKAKVRFVQASSGIGSGNLLGNGVSLFTAQSFKTVSSFSEVNAGAYVFTITNAGSSTTLATSTSVTLQAGKNYTVYTSGISGTTGGTALAVNVLAGN